MKSKWWLNIKSLAKTYVSMFEALAIILTVAGVLYLLAQLNHMLAFALILAAWLIYLIAKAIVIFTPAIQRGISVSQVNFQREPKKIKAVNKMKHKPDRKSDYQIAWQCVVVVVAAVILSVFIVTGFQCSLILNTFHNLWLMFTILVVIVSGLLFLVMKYPLWTATTVLLIFAFIFMFASFKNSPLEQALQGYINKTFDTNFLLGSITFLALAVALVAILKSRNK
jgi:hypothetical protein